MSDNQSRVAVETVKNAVLYSDGTILLKNVRCSYPAVFQMKTTTDPKTGATNSAYSCVGLMPKETHEEAKKLCVRQMAKILKDSNKGAKLASDRKFLKDGDPKDEDDDAKPENVGMWIVSAREGKKRPQTLSNKKDPKTGKARRLSPDVQNDVDMIYGGCWINMLVRLWWQDNSYGKRINAGIIAVQFVRDDEPFGSGRIKDDDIDSTFDAEDEEDATESDDDISDL